MTLQEWFEETGIKMVVFCKKLGVSRHVLYNWVSGRTLPKEEDIEKICKLTLGQVTMKDFEKGTHDRDQPNRKPRTLASSGGHTL